MKLHTYTLRYDFGAAPNPFWGICTLAIARPALRLTAEVDDWIVGLGSPRTALGDISGHIVYAMKVTDKITLEEYDQFCRTFLPKKMPDWRNKDYRMRLGDCIYNFATKDPKMRTSVHTEENKAKDLGGKYALLSKQFYYFGDLPEILPEELRPIMYDGMAHQTEANQPYLDAFIHWIESLDYPPNKPIGEPQHKDEIIRGKNLQTIIASRDLQEDE
jgi:hypothetical protein